MWGGSRNFEGTVSFYSKLLKTQLPRDGLTAKPRYPNYNSRDVPHEPETGVVGMECAWKIRGEWGGEHHMMVEKVENENGRMSRTGVL